MLLWKSLDFQIRANLLDPDCRMVVLGLNDSEGGTFRLGTVYAQTGAGKPDFFRHLETFLGKSCMLVLVEDWNSILNAWKECVGLINSRRRCKSLENLLRTFQFSYS